MSSRKGNVVTALDILEAARVAGEATGTNPSEGTILAAVKYAFAKTRIGGDIVYDPKESVALEGNSGPYLQYAHARAKSILRNVAQSNGAAVHDDVVFEEDERVLARKLVEYSDVLAKACIELMPHHISTYLYELAQVFNRFYENNRVAGHERQAQRVRLITQYAAVLADGLGLLGIEAPDKI
jgi:arginyl-tRNA synthetase